MNEFAPGTVVIVGTGQAGTVIWLNKEYWVLLANGDFWHGFESQMHEPQSQEELKAAKYDVDRFEGR